MVINCDTYTLHTTISHKSYNSTFVTMLFIDNCGANPVQCQNAGFLNHQCQCYCPASLTGSDCSQIQTDSGQARFTHVTIH